MAAAAEVGNVLESSNSSEISSENKSESAAIFRFHSGAADEVESEFHSAFNAARASFQKRLDATFLLESLFQDHRLDAKALASDRFAQLINGYQNENGSFPLTRELAEIWATGGSDAELQNAWARPLRAAMQHCILAQPVLDEASRFDHAILVSVTNLAQTISPAVAQENGKEIARSDFYTLDKAKRELELVFSPEEKPVADFLASFLKENCAYGLEPKQPSAPKVIEAVVASATTDEAATNKSEAIVAAPKTVQPNNPSRKNGSAFIAFFSSPSTQTILAAAATGLGLLLIVIWLPRRIRSTKEKARRLPASNASEVIEETASFSAPENLEVQPTVPIQAEIEFWRNRALEAERRLETVSATTRSHLMPHLARMLMDKFVQRLFSQRTVLLNTQEMATLKVVEMEKQLEKIHASHECQLEAYRLRIERLEKELAAKTEENRALIRTAMQLTERGL